MSYFNEIKDKTLRAYNRMSYLRALQEDAGVYEAEQYLKKLSKHEQKEIAQVIVGIERMGVAAFKRSMTVNLEGL